MIVESFRIEIDRPVERVFAILTDLEQYLARWAKGPVSARKSTPGDGVGTTFDVVARVGPLEVRSPYEVEQWEPPHRFGGSGTAGPVAFREEYVLSANGRGTAVDYRIEARPRGLFRGIEPLVRRQLRRLLTGDLEHLRTLVEQEA